VQSFPTLRCCERENREKDFTAAVFYWLSHEEVAARMGRALGAVGMLWLRALSRLRRELGQGSDSPRRVSWFITAEPQGRC
jgi:hypothetical protein